MNPTFDRINELYQKCAAERDTARADAATLAAALETAAGVWENAERAKPLGKSGLGNPPIWVCDARAALAAHEGATR